MTISFHFKKMSRSEKALFLKHASKAPAFPYNLRDVQFLTAGQHFSPESVFCAVHYNRTKRTFTLLDVIFIDRRLWGMDFTGEFFTNLIYHFLEL